ncbi:MAG TPA: YtxH domain-containing protein [Microlunatus sp.]
MGFLDDIKNKAGELGDKAGDAFEVAKDKAGDLIDTGKDKAGDLVDAAKDKLDTDDDGDVDTADATHTFHDLKDRVAGGGDAPADQVAAAAGGAAVGGAPSAGTEYTTPSVEPLSDVAADPVGPDLVAEEAVFTEDVAGDPIATPLDESVDSAGAAEDEALADLQAKADDLRSDNA